MQVKVNNIHEKEKQKKRGESVTNTEKAIFMNKGAIMMDFNEDNAVSILSQAMMDETLRLRKCRWKKERDSIRRFLIESFQIISVNIQDMRNPEKS